MLASAGIPSQLGLIQRREAVENLQPVAPPVLEVVIDPDIVEDSVMVEEPDFADAPVLVGAVAPLLEGQTAAVGKVTLTLKIRHVSNLCGESFNLCDGSQP